MTDAINFDELTKAFASQTKTDEADVLGPRVAALYKLLFGVDIPKDLASDRVQVAVVMFIKRYATTVAKKPEDYDEADAKAILRSIANADVDASPTSPTAPGVPADDALPGQTPADRRRAQRERDAPR